MSLAGRLAKEIYRVQTEEGEMMSPSELERVIANYLPTASESKAESKLAAAEELAQLNESMANFFEDNYEDAGIEIFGHVSWGGHSEPTESAKFVNKWREEVRAALASFRNR